MKVVSLFAVLLISPALHSFSASESPGPSSRRTPIAISEIMCKPAKRVDQRNTEFVELYNSNPWPEDISNYQLAGDVRFRFPVGTSIAAQGFVVVAAVPVDLQTVYGLATVFGPYTNSLKTSGTIRLLDEQGSRLLEIEYNNEAPWPMGADGTGHSIVLARASYGENYPRAWNRSQWIGGSPGTFEAPATNALNNVVINEILAHTDPPDIDSIELYNHSNFAINLAGCTLSDDPVSNKFVIPSGITIPARGFVYFTETQLGFGLEAAGETIYFKNTNATQVLDALKFGAQENGVPFGRSPNGATDWSRLGSKTFGTNNAAPLVSPIGFNEIMYHPISGEDDDQYIELYNHGTNAINLTGWKLGGGITFKFATNQVLAPNSYLVVARNVTQMLGHYPQLNTANCVGNFGGKLSASGERLILTMPDTTLSTNGLGVVTTNYLDIVVDEVTYGTGGRWGRWSDGGGSSLELIDARADERLAANWADSDETTKAPWTTIQTTGVLDNGSGAVSPMQLGLLGAGECLVDNVEFLPGTSGPNYADNPGFENGMTSLSFVGDHSRSSLEAGSGYPAGGFALHLRTADAISAGPNAVQISLTNSIAAGQTATLRFKARWLHGCPEPLLRLWGCYLEATGRLSIPANLGTPGLPNSRVSTNAGPAIYQVRHDPAVPAANVPVVVSARVSDPNGLASLTLQYRFDPSNTTTNLLMNDAGINGDAIAGDGIYSATLPGRPTNAIAFVLLATDTAGATNRFPEMVPDNAPVRECVVFFGEPNPTNLFGTYHLWLTQTNVNRWKALPFMSNEDMDGTLVYNDRIIYNMSARYAGSPWHQNYDGPAGNRACHYVWGMPKDDLMLGTSSFNQIHWPGNDIQGDTITSVVNDATLQREQAANMFLRQLGVPWINRRLVAVYVNGTRRGKLMEDADRPTAGGVQDQYFSDDSDGQFYKIQRWYEGTSTSLISEGKLQQYTTTGGAKKTARYRPNWALKDSPGSLSNFTNLYTLITAATAYAQPNYVNFIENVVDAENWMRFSAANHAGGNWDCFGSTTGQNADAWISPQHRWTLFTIDFSICLDNNLSGVGLFSFSDNAWSQMFAKPKFSRMYYRALNELVNGVMQSSVINPILDAKYAAITAAGISASAPTSTKTWIANQRSSIISSIASANAAAFALGASSYLTATNSVTLTGTAPVSVVALSINGISYTPTWTGLTSWSLTLPVGSGSFNWTVEALDKNGNMVGGSVVVSVENTSEPESLLGNIVFNEIMFNPAWPGAEYIELFNRSTNTTFDLSGWVVKGIDYTFPVGSVLLPRKYLVLAKSSVAFANAYGATVPVFDTFSGSLQSDGETLSLIQQSVPPEFDFVIDRVRYETSTPWPTAPVSTPGVSLQLIDANQDNSRVANWNSSLVTRNTPGAANSTAAALPEFPSLWLNEVQAENLTGPTDNFAEHDPWVELYNSGSDVVSLDGLYLGTNYSNPIQWAFPVNVSIAPGQFLVVWLDGQSDQSTNEIWHTDFRLNAAGGTLALSRLVNGSPQIVDYLNFLPLPVNYSYGDFPDAQPFYRKSMYLPSPATMNNTKFPPLALRLNEWMADNTGYLLDPATAKYDDWFELYNTSDTAADLTGFYLTDALINPFQFQIPAGYTVPAHGFLLVWADGKPSANTNTNPDLHVSFKLDKDGEALGLFAPDGSAVDAVVFGTQASNISEGRFPDAGELRLFMPEPSPRLPNILPPSLTAPSFSEVTMQPDATLALTFQTAPGHTYRVEYKDNLADLNWLPLGTDHFATDVSLTIIDTATNDQRFYRIRQVQ